MMNFNQGANEAPETTGKRAKRKVLLVEDDPINARLIRKVMEQVGHEVEHIDEGRKALQRLRGEPPDVVMMDCMLPGASGLDITRALRRTPRWSNVPVIMLTARDDTESKVAGLSAGADDYITKPFHWAELVARTESHLRARSLQEELARTTENLAEQKSQEEQLSEQLRAFNEHTVNLVIGMIELYDAELGAHCRRCSLLVRDAAPEFGLDPTEAQLAELAALMMEVGMIGLPKAALGQAPESLPAEQATQLRNHPEVGCDFLRELPGLRNVGVIIRHHHEAWDGTGWPDGLRTSAIPRESRLVAAAAAFEHAHAGGASGEDALAVLGRQAGTTLDPEAVRAVAGAVRTELGRRLTPQEVAPNKLEPGMRLAADVRTRDGRLLLGRGAELSHGLVARLQNQVFSGQVAPPLFVYGR